MEAEVGGIERLALAQGLVRRQRYTSGKSDILDYIHENFNVGRVEALYPFQEEALLWCLLVDLYITFTAKVLLLCLLSLAPQFFSQDAE